MKKGAGIGSAHRILFTPLRWWFLCGIIGVFLLVLLLALAVDYRGQIRLHPGLVLQKEMNKYLRGKRIDDIIPRSMANGEVVWLVRDTDERPYYSDRLIVLTREENRDLWNIPGEMKLYGVRMSSAKETVVLSGQTVDNVAGFIGSPGPDGLVDYRPADRMLAVYDPTNGSTSSGDIVNLFRR